MIALAVAACASPPERADTVRSDSAALDTLGVDSTAKASTDDCVRGEPEPVLAGARVTSRFQRTGKLAAVEDAVLDDTTSLRIAHGGCAHYVENYTFTVRGTVRDTAESVYWLTRTIAYLRELEVGERRAAQVGQIVAALEAAAAKREPYVYGEPLSVPEFTTISLTVRRASPGSTEIEVVYDVAL